MTKSNTRIQLRSTCAICGCDHAVDGAGRVATHGYTVAWNQFNNACGGSGKVHYGHKNAPQVIQNVIESLEKYLSELPEILANARETLENTPRPERMSSIQERRQYDQLTNRVRSLEFNLETGVPNAIEQYKARKADWKEFEPREVDLEVEAAEQKAAREAEKAKKAAEKAKKEEEKAARKAKAEENARKKYIELVETENFHRLWYKGEMIEEWTAKYEDERAYYDDHNTRKRAHLTKVGVTEHHEQHWAFMSGEVWTETRNKADGKGRRLNSTKI